MRSPRGASHLDETRAPAKELSIPAGRHPVPTRTRLHTRRIPVAMYVIALLVVPGLVVVGFMSAGLWATTGTSSITAQSGTASGEGGTDGVAPAAAPAAPAAPADPADVKGSMTVQQVLDAFPTITAAQILAQFKAPLDTPTSTQLKDLVEDSDGMDLPAVRTWLQEQGAK